ncbi:MAG TPA: SPOR domain-containing protein [Phaeodactylibacter sp.]|nr:SPOR domain-containing protein [Phaeodactylibacter sp.]
MNPKNKYQFILPFFFLFAVGASAQNISDIDKETHLLEMIYLDMTTPEERQELLSENPNEPFLVGTISRPEIADSVPNIKDDGTIIRVMQPEDFIAIQAQDHSYDNTTSGIVKYDDFSVIQEPEKFEGEVATPIGSAPSTPPKTIEMVDYQPVIAAKTSIDRADNHSSTSSLTPATTNPTSTKKKINYQVQLGYFKNLKYAIRLSEKTKKQYSEPVEIAEDYQKDGVYYRVLIGKFDNLRDAQKLFTTIKQKGQRAALKTKPF